MSEHNRAIGATVPTAGAACTWRLPARSDAPSKQQRSQYKATLRWGGRKAQKQRAFCCTCAGATALDKRSAKAYKAAMLAKLGAAADKRPRMPAKIGLGMAKKAKQREAVALQEAIAAGMVKAKGRGKKERALKGELVLD